MCVGPKFDGRRFPGTVRVATISVRRNIRSVSEEFCLENGWIQSLYPGLLSRKHSNRRVVVFECTGDRQSRKVRKTAMYCLTIRFVRLLLWLLSRDEKTCCISVFFPPRVCKTWKRLVKDQRLWRVVDLTWKGVRMPLAVLFVLCFVWVFFVFVFLMGVYIWTPIKQANPCYVIKQHTIGHRWV